MPESIAEPASVLEELVAEADKLLIVHGLCIRVDGADVVPFFRIGAFLRGGFALLS